MTIAPVQADHYRIPLPVTLSDSTHGVHDLHVHLLAAVPNKPYLEVHGFGLERFMATPLEIEDGCATAPERPGHGVELDWPARERLRARGRLRRGRAPQAAARDRRSRG